MTYRALYEISLLPVQSQVLFPRAEITERVTDRVARRMIIACYEEHSPIGVVQINRRWKKPYTVGTTANILNLELLDSGALQVKLGGVERFEIRHVSSDNKQILAAVRPIVDEPGDTHADANANLVADKLGVYLQLYRKVHGRAATVAAAVPTTAEDLSYWVGASLSDVPKDQQELLEMTSTSQRLTRQIELLTQASKGLAALSAIEEAFAGTK